MSKPDILHPPHQIKTDLIVWRDPAELRMHWTRKELPTAAKDSEAVKSLSDDIARGIQLPPIYIVAPNLVVAGWTRTLAHHARQCERIACIEISEEEAPLVALKENTNRQVWPKKFQIAWVYAPLALRVISNADKRKIENLTHARKSNSGLSSGPGTMDELADDLQVSRALLFTVVSAYQKIIAWDKENKPRCWGDDKEKKSALDHANELILHPEDPCTPGNIVAGLAGRKAADEGKTKPEPKQLELFCEGFSALQKWGKAFVKFDGPQRKKAVDAVKRAVGAWPSELRHELTAELKRLEREEKESQS